MTPEEIRIRALIANKADDTSLLDNVPQHIQVIGLYPESPADDWKSKEFRDKISQWPDVKAAAVKKGLFTRHREYLLCPYGSLTKDDLRFVPEKMVNKDGDKIMLVADRPTETYIQLRNVAAFGVLSMRSGGVYLTNLEYVSPALEELVWRNMVSFRPLLEMKEVNKKLRIAIDCKITGAYASLPQHILASPMKETQGPKKK